MVLVYLFGFVFFTLLLAIVFIIFSVIRIKIENWKVTNVETQNDKKYSITTSIHLFNKLQWLSIRLDNKKIQKIFTKLHLDSLDIKKLERDFKFSDIIEIVQIKPKITELDLQVKVGIADVLLTTYIVPFLATVISIVLSNSAKSKNMDKIKYEVKPIYESKNVYEITLNTILEIRLLNLLNSSYRIYANRKNEKNKMEKQENKINCNV